MHSRFLRYFDEVVRRGSIRQAAEHLHIAPSAVNRQILELEAQLGAALFQRIGKRLRLTPLGDMVLAHVRQTLRAHDVLRLRIAAIKDGRQGEVSMALTAGLASTLMPALVQNFRTQFPGITLRLFDMPMHEIIRVVEQGEVDMALAYDLTDTATFQTLAVADWKIGVVTAPNHPLATRTSIHLEECANHPLVLPAPTLSIRPIVDDIFARAGIGLSPVVETTSITLITHLVSLGTGISLLNPLDVLEPRASGTLAFIPLHDSHLLQGQTLRLVKRTGSMQSAPAGLMAESIAQALAELLAVAL